MPAKAGREYWQGVLVAGGSTVIPRWTPDPRPGVGECTMAVSGAGAAALRGPAAPACVARRARGGPGGVVR